MGSLVTGWWRGRWGKALAGIVLTGAALCLGVVLWIKLEPVVRGCKSIPTAGKVTKVIFHSGRYCLLSDLNWDKAGAPIIISKSNITLDLNGFTIRGNKQKLNQVGILLSDGVSGVSIENGNIEFVQVGIRAKEVQQFRVSKVNFHSISWLGLHLNGSDNSVINSNFTDIGVRDDGSDGDAYAVGIMAAGDNFLIEKNTFSDIARQPVPQAQSGEGVSIIVSENSSNFKILNNTFKSVSSSSTENLGIWVRGKGILIASNKFISLGRPIGGKLDAANRVLGNEFKSPDSYKTNNGGSNKHAAVSVNMTDSSLLIIKNNIFSGYYCPVQLFSEVPKRLELDAENNRADWPAGGRACMSGVWHSDVINWPEPPK